MSSWMRKHACRVMSALNPEHVFLANGEPGNWWDAHSFIPGHDRNSTSPGSFRSIPAASEALIDEETYEIVSQGSIRPPAAEDIFSAETVRLTRQIFGGELDLDDLVKEAFSVIRSIVTAEDSDPCPVDITEERQGKRKKEGPCVKTVTVDVHHQPYKCETPECHTSAKGAEDPPGAAESNEGDPMALTNEADEELQLEVASTGSGSGSGSGDSREGGEAARPLCKTVGHLQDPKFAMMKLAKSGRVWLSPRSDDLLIVKEDGRVVLPPSARLNYMTQGKSYPRQLKQRMGKFYDRLFLKKETKSKAFEWGTCSLDRRSTLKCKSRKPVEGSRSDNGVCGLASSGSKISV